MRTQHAGSLHKGSCNLKKPKIPRCFFDVPFRMTVNSWQRKQRQHGTKEDVCCVSVEGMRERHRVTAA